VESQNHKLQFDPVSGLLTIKLGGFWDDKSVHLFRGELRSTMQQITSGNLDFQTLCDCRGFVVQSQTVMNEIAQTMANGVETKLGRTAIVVDSVLSKMQINRLVANPKIRLFENFELASAWLAEGYGSGRSGIEKISGQTC
jgi:hypothetical protein